MFCSTWNHLFEQYERATLKRVERSKGRSYPVTVKELEQLNLDITAALRALREHEKQHHCH